MRLFLPGAKVFSMETVEMPKKLLKTGGPEVMYCLGDVAHIIGLRLYLDGAYSEPPPEALPSVPQIQNDDCCVIL